MYGIMAKSTTIVLREKPVVVVFRTVLISQSAQKLLSTRRVGVDRGGDTIIDAKQQIAIASYMVRCSCSVLKKIERKTSDRHKGNHGKTRAEFVSLSDYHL